MVAIEVKVDEMSKEELRKVCKLLIDLHEKDEEVIASYEAVVERWHLRNKDLSAKYVELLLDKKGGSYEKSED